MKKTVIVIMLPSCLAALAQPPKREVPLLDLSAPLGTPSNPVRASMPPGQREYLMRLRCPEGDEPTFARQGSLGRGPHGSTVDRYRVTCKSGHTAFIVMDMYHRGYREMEAVPGFSVLPELPAKVAQGCPPAVPGVAPGQYVFRPLEVRKGASIDRSELKVTRPGLKGRAYVRAVVDDAGSLVPASIEVVYSETPELEAAASEVARSLRFRPAEHHAGCFVPQHLEFPLQFQ